MYPCILQNHCLTTRTTHSIVDPLREVVLDLSCIWFLDQYSPSNSVAHVWLPVDVFHPAYRDKNVTANPKSGRVH